MSLKQKRWESVDRASIPIATLIERYLSACRSAGMSSKTIRGYNEKLRRYVRGAGQSDLFMKKEASNFEASLDQKNNYTP